MTIEAESERLNFGEVRLQDPGGDVVTVRISARRFYEIHKRTAGRITYSRSSGQEDNLFHDVEFAHFLSNALMPCLMGSVLRDVLTPYQLQRVLTANRNGKSIKFEPATSGINNIVHQYHPCKNSK